MWVRCPHWHQIAATALVVALLRAYAQKENIMGKNTSTHIRIFLPGGGWVTLSSKDNSDRVLDALLALGKGETHGEVSTGDTQDYVGVVPL